MAASAPDYSIYARDSLRLTLEKHAIVLHGKPTLQGIKERAEFLMLAKNALSLYRDGYLAQKDRETMMRFIKAHLDYTSAALAAADDWPLQGKQLLRTMHYHALAANQLITMPNDNPNFEGLMATYHSGIGYEAYRSAEAFGIEQVWEFAL